MNTGKISIRKPAWLRKRLPAGADYEKTRVLMGRSHLHTVCQEAKCPNIFECFARHTATFLILGHRCTRNCRFCAVESGACGPPDPDEPRRMAEAAAGLGLRYVVITSVTRDDLEDGGAAHFAACIEAVRSKIPGVLVEVLIPDLLGDPDALQTVLDARPQVLNHNVETVPRLYPQARPRADYRRSLDLLAKAAELAPGIVTKSGLMLGLGETDDEILEVLKDLRRAGCRVVTMGQYLQPGRNHLPVARFVTPEKFASWQAKALEMGFAAAACGPFVRSSYRAGRVYRAAVAKATSSS